MDPLTLTIAGLFALGLYSAAQSRKRRRKDREDDELDFDEADTQIEFADDCSEWFMPSGWVTAHAEPIWMRELSALASMDSPDPDPTPITQFWAPGDPEEWLVAVTYEILRDQLPSDCPEPIVDILDEDDNLLYVIRFRELQTVIPDAEDYWDADESILGLYDHVYEAASNALERWLLDEPAILFPVDE